MPSEKAEALVLRCTDWSETSRIVTLWTRELGKVRGLAKGGRRLRSNFENALDLLTHCRIVLLRKSSGSLDLLTEAQVVQRFPNLRANLTALYGAYYLAELLSEGCEDLDPHPELFDEAVATLEALGGESASSRDERWFLWRLMRFEMVWLRELGFSPVLDRCVGCSGTLLAEAIGFSCAAGGTVCQRCRNETRDSKRLSDTARTMLVALAQGEETEGEANTQRELRNVLGQYETYVLGRRLRVLPMLMQIANRGTT